ncbi:DJ-1/PfpI family protein [Nocardia cyriacigeorgica]|uniref:DJ-1/PfpI family protein n=1 Tax=Nocardia cyriacigeorgica TaxID=135487 RepID=UPI003EDF3BBA
MKQAQHRVGLVLFDGFEVLDVFGPVELFSRLPAEYPISYVASHEGPVRSSQGVEVIATDSFETSPAPDIVMVPGGMGTRELAGNTTFLRELADWAKSAALITSVVPGRPYSQPPACWTDTAPPPTRWPSLGLPVTAPMSPGFRAHGGSTTEIDGLRPASPQAWT